MRKYLFPYHSPSSSNEKQLEVIVLLGVFQLGRVMFLNDALRLVLLFLSAPGTRENKRETTFLKHLAAEGGKWYVRNDRPSCQMRSKQRKKARKKERKKGGWKLLEAEEDSARRGMFLFLLEPSSPEPRRLSDEPGCHDPFAPERSRRWIN